jgi:hypothetical protein
MRKDWDYPPYPYLEQVLLETPGAGRTYMKLWERRNPLNITEIKANMRNEYGKNLKQHLWMLCEQGLINVSERPSTLFVELVNWDNEDDSDM